MNKWDLRKESDRMTREWLFKCTACGEDIRFGEEEAYELQYWPKDDDGVQVAAWHARCLPEQIKPFVKR
jgi:hypothetical protein